MPTKTFNLSEETIAKLKAELNQSQTIEKALDFYWNNKDLGRKLIANSDQILKLIADFQEQQQSQPRGLDDMGNPREGTLLDKARREHPGWLLKNTPEGIMALDRQTKAWMPLEVAEENERDRLY